MKRDSYRTMNSKLFVKKEKGRIKATTTKKEMRSTRIRRKNTKMESYEVTDATITTES